MCVYNFEDEISLIFFLFKLSGIQEEEISVFKLQKILSCNKAFTACPLILKIMFPSFQVADFGLAHASKDGSICFEPVNTDIRGTPG